MTIEPWGWVFSLYLGALLYALLLTAGDLPDRARPLTCSKHPGTAKCVCRGDDFGGKPRQ